MGYTVIGNDQEVGQTSKKQKTDAYWTKMGMNILLVVIIGLSLALSISSFYFNELFMEFAYPFRRLGMQVLAILAITLYTEFVYQVVFAKWAYPAGVGTLFMLGIFVLFVILGLITFVVFLWYSLVQWWTNGLIGLGFVPVVLAVVMFVVFIIRRVVNA